MNVESQNHEFLKGFVELDTMAIQKEHKYYLMDQYAEKASLVRAEFAKLLRTPIPRNVSELCERLSARRAPVRPRICEKYVAFLRQSRRKHTNNIEYSEY